VDTTMPKSTPLAKQPVSLQRASFVKLQIPEEKEMGAVVRAPAPITNAHLHPLACNHLGKSSKYGVGSSAGSSVTSISSAGLPRSQSTVHIGLKPRRNLSRRQSLLSRSDTQPVVSKWEDFWGEETAATVAAAAVESEVGLVTASSTEAKKKEKEKEKEMSGFRKFARAFALSRRNA
jgi:molybdenum cofactor sulfurtransferase